MDLLPSEMNVYINHHWFAFDDLNGFLVGRGFFYFSCRCRVGRSFIIQSTTSLSRFTLDGGKFVVRNIHFRSKIDEVWWNFSLHEILSRPETFSFANPQYCLCRRFPFENTQKHANIRKEKNSLSVDWIFKGSRAKKWFSSSCQMRKIFTLSIKSPSPSGTPRSFLATCHMNYCFFLVPRLYCV